MKVLSNLEFKNSTYILNKFNDFPENPSEGTVIFKENGLYIYSLSQISGQLEWLNILDFTRTNASFKFEQGTESTEWNIAHNLNTQDLFVIVYDSDGNKQIESEIQFQSDNEVKLIFSEPISGKALLFGASVISSPSNIYTKEEIDELLKNIEVSGGSGNIILPENGTDGQVLIKDSSTESGLNWSDQNKTEYPSNGSNGQVLIHDDTTEIGAKWGLIQTPHNMNIGDMGYTYSDNPPSNALFCGGIVSKTQYPELYNVIGDKFTSDNALISKDKLIVPEWDFSENDSVISNIESDLTLGEDSYYTAILNDSIRVTTRGNSGGLSSDGRTCYAGWYAFNNAPYPGGSNCGYQWSTYENGTSILEVEYLDGTKFAPYQYGIKRRAGYNIYYFTAWKFLGYDDSTQEWIILDEHNNGTTEYPPYNEIKYFKISSYDNTKLYSKFRLEVTCNTYAQIDFFRIYGTKEGEDSIYDLFALPPSVEDTTGAKNYIIATPGNDKDYNFSTEERVIGTWIDGKPIYRRTLQLTSPNTLNTYKNVYDCSDFNIELVTNLYGTMIGFSDNNSKFNVTINYYYGSGETGDVGISTYYDFGSHSIKMGVNHQHYMNSLCYINMEYTKTTN